MKSKDKKEIFLKTEIELGNLLKEAKNLLFSLKIEKSQNKLKDIRSIFTKRKDIALILTILKQKQLSKGVK